jgi:hypothetical protein
MTFSDLENSLGQGQPKVNQVGSIDHKTFLLSLIEIFLVVFSEPRSQDIYAAKPG